MKMFYCILFYFSFSTANAQQVLSATMLQVSDKKTTHIVFPFSIIAGDCGSNDVRAQRMKGADNILQVKAAKNDFAPTNLTVITEEGKLYSFELRYCAYPGALSIRFEKDSGVGLVNNLSHNRRTMETRAVQIIAANENHHVKRICPAGLELQLKGIYTDDHVVYYHVSMTNLSSLVYDIDALRFTVEDKKPAKRSVRQVIEMVPLLVFGPYASVQRDSTIQFVVALATKSLRRSQRLFIRVMENNGVRHLFLTIKPQWLLRARPL
jgi:conjugative transposon TraN protein